MRAGGAPDHDAACEAVLAAAPGEDPDGLIACLRALPTARLRSLLVNVNVCRLRAGLGGPREVLRDMDRPRMLSRLVDMTSDDTDRILLAMVVCNLPSVPD